MSASGSWLSSTHIECGRRAGKRLTARMSGTRDAIAGSRKVVEPEKSTGE